MFRRLFLLLLAMSTGLASAQDVEVRPARRVTVNDYVLNAIRQMPTGGQYAVGRAAFDGLGRAVALSGEGLAVQPREAQPSFCSGATYLVFVHVLENLRARGVIALSDATRQALLVAGQRDGQGVWGRWNANGPGTARLFTELGLGPNFTDWKDAAPGDFMKIFWTDEIGARERGHSVVYLGQSVQNGTPMVTFWSSNTAKRGTGEVGGYGEQTIPRSRVKLAIFSRLETPRQVGKVGELPKLDKFLASMLSKRATLAEVRAQCGM